MKRTLLTLAAFTAACAPAAPPPAPAHAQITMTATPAAPPKVWARVEIPPVGFRAWFPGEPEAFFDKEEGSPVQGWRLEDGTRETPDFAAFWSTTKRASDMVDLETVEERFGDDWKDLDQRARVVRNGRPGMELRGTGPLGPMAVRIVTEGRWFYVLEVAGGPKGKDAQDANRFFDGATIDPPWRVEALPSHAATLSVPAAATHEESRADRQAHHRFLLATSSKDEQESGTSEDLEKGFELFVFPGAATPGAGGATSTEAEIQQAVRRLEKTHKVPSLTPKTGTHAGHKSADVEGQSEDGRRVRARAVAGPDRVFLLCASDTKDDPLPDGAAERYFDSLWFR